ncbi:MAG: hypothetical protein OJF49_001178 [Ktedonobacterales bacterium]|nr:MAG: hypothetical protein OJF49_001178 [Ktedonobacterales bacterium]
MYGFSRHTAWIAASIAAFGTFARNAYLESPEPWSTWCRAVFNWRT